MSAPTPRRRRSARREQGPPAQIRSAAADPTVSGGPGQDDDRAGRLRKRPRRRAPASPPPVLDSPEPPAVDHPSPMPSHRDSGPRDSGPRDGSRDRRTDHAERALRGLVTTRGTQVSWSSAIRAREVALPTAEDLAEAAAEVVVVRRNYTPQEPLKNSRPEANPRPRRGGS